ncbi:MAG: YgiQ family radical SAM protein [Spirochaetales bacterium]|nr:YgiQ family radical SAM protein [Spirochaetales bacterium]
MSFLPVCQKDLEKLGLSSVDFIIIGGDAYVDHPSFGSALIGRVLEDAGYSVGIIAQPDWTNPNDFKKLGKPNLAFLVTAGNIDSMVARYTANRKRRSDDAYSPGGFPGKRPDRASIVYTSVLKGLFKNSPVILGGLEASLRRLAHYDYWSDRVRRSLLADAKADLLVYGMAEQTILEIAGQLAAGRNIAETGNIPGTVVRRKDAPADALLLPAFEECVSSKQAFLESFRIQYANTDPFTAKTLAEKTGDSYIIQFPPAMPLEQEALDHVYALAFTRRWHPDYDKFGGVPALEEVKFSITHTRGCFGACNFCALTFHQGRIVSSRSEQSLLDEAALIAALPDFKGYIHDVGGPTANFAHAACTKQSTQGACRNRQCLFPSPCPSLDTSHARYTAILRKMRNLPGIKKVFIRSGLRHDYILAGDNTEFIDELVRHHISGQLKLAPEHASAVVLACMGKPPIEAYLQFREIFDRKNSEIGKKQYIIPYLISSHPGSSIKEAVEMALFLKNNGFIPDQIQDFYPTPGTLSTCMYHTGIDPRNGCEVYVPKNEKERKIQRALLQFHRKENHNLVREGLRLAGRPELFSMLTGVRSHHMQNRTRPATHHRGKKQSR